MNYTKRTFSGSGSWTAPAGVASVRLTLAPAQTNVVVNNGVSTFYIDPYGKMLSCGSNLSGMLGSGASGVVTPMVSSPILVAGGLSWTQVWAPVNNAIWGQTAQGQLYAWGGAMLLGVGTLGSTISSPTLVIGNLPPIAMVVQSGSTSGALFLGQNGQAFYSGSNLQGEGGLNTVTAVSVPNAVVGGYSFVSVTGGTYNFYGITTTGAMYAWGGNLSGQLGNNTVVPSSSPVLVVGGQFWAAVCGMGSYQVLALTMLGQAYTWGLNTYGGLGINNPTVTAAYSSPVAVVGGYTFSSITNSYCTCYGLTAVGAAYAWGSNAFGLCGNFSGNSAFSSPVAVVGGYSFTQIVTDQYNNGSTFGLTASGALYGWGNNSFGQLGNGTIAHQSSPVLVLGGLSFSSVSIASGSVIGVTTAGQIYVWGYNYQGNLGTGNLTSYSSPVLLATTGQALAKMIPGAGPITTVLQVTPGQSYAFNFKFQSATQWGAATFGSTVIGQGNFASLTLEYFA